MIVGLTKLTTSYSLKYLNKDKNRINCDSHSSLWSKTTAFEKSQRGYSLPEATTVSCQMPNYVSYKKICIFKSSNNYSGLRRRGSIALWSSINCSRLQQHDSELHDIHPPLTMVPPVLRPGALPLHTSYCCQHHTTACYSSSYEVGNRTAMHSGRGA